MTSGFSRSRSQYHSSIRVSPWWTSSVGRLGAAGGVGTGVGWHVMPVEVQRTATGAVVVVDGQVRATFVGDLDDPGDRAALEEMVKELFPTVARNVDDLPPS